MGVGETLESLPSLNRELELMTPLCLLVGRGQAVGHTDTPRLPAPVPRFLWVWRPAGGSEQWAGSPRRRHRAHPLPCGALQLLGRDTLAFRPPALGLGSVGRVDVLCYALHGLSS